MDKPRALNPDPRMIAMIVAMACLAATGCRRGPRNYLNENDQLRRDNMELRQQIQELEQAVALRVAEVERLQQQPGRTPVAVEGAKVPHVTAVRFDRYSGAIDTDGNGTDDIVRLYVRTLDEQGRFIPAAGRAVVQAVLIKPGGITELLNEKTYDPQAFDAAYRSGLTGTHYTLELALPSPLPPDADQATVKLTFTDAATGASLTHEMPVSIHR